MEKRRELLVRALNLFNPEHVLQGRELDEYYVSRPHAPLESMKTYLRANQQHVKVLFTGHKGSGKSTELARLGKDLEEEFFVVPFSARSLDLTDLKYVDVILACAAALLLKVTDRKNPVAVPDKVLEDVMEWLTSEITWETTITTSKSRSIGARLSALIFNLQGKYSRETSTRQTVREKLSHRVSDLIQHVNILCRQIERNTRPPLIIFEDIDKADLESASSLFFEHAKALTSPACRIIYTFPISLRHASYFAASRRDYNHDFSLPNVNVCNKDNSPDDDGRDALRSVITRRISPEIFLEGALNGIVEMSGGLMLDLVRLVSEAALVTLSQKADEITSEIVERVAADMANHYRRILFTEHYEVLRQAHETKKVVFEAASSAAVREVLDNLSLLEYLNDDVWWDVHPVVRRLIESD